MKALVCLSVLAGSILCVAQAAYAADSADMGSMNMQQEPVTATAAVHQGHGVVNNVNEKTGKINISHDAIASLKWPAMTMDFAVQKTVKLGGIKPGMKVDFDLLNTAGGYQIVRIKTVK
jgi:Cu/Ag efflux protein CusF